MQIACRALLEECGVGRSLPIPLRPLCRRLGIRVVRRHAIGAGTLRAAHGNLQIWLPVDATNWRRERFTIAHEIAHILLFSTWSRAHGGMDSKVVASDEESELERLCNFGAAELLMPTEPMTALLAEVGVSPRALRNLYDSCLVSYESMLYRLAEISAASAVILWRRHARRPSEAEELRVITSYQRYRKSTHAPWLPKGCTSKHLSPDIVTPAYERGEAIPSYDVVLAVGRREIRCVGVASVLPKPRLASNVLPLFEGMRIVDERLPEVDVVLLVSNRTMTPRPAFLGMLAAQPC
jgi:hypothetical protein